MIPRSVSKKLHLDESVLHVVRPSWWYYTPSLLFWSVVIGIGVFFSYPLITSWGWGWVATFALLVIGGCGLCSVIIRRYYTVFLWTNHRIIDIHKPSLFETQEIDTPIEAIADIRYTTEGVIQTVLRLGTVIIQPSQENGYIELRWISQPSQVKERLQRLLRNNVHHVNEATSSKTQRI